MNIGTDYLYPVFCEEVIPSDIIELKLDSYMRILDFVVPPMDKLQVKFFFFFVPNRTVWEHWETFIGAEDLSDYDEDNPRVEYSVPKLELKPRKYSIYDYLKEPLSTEDGGNVKENIKINALKLRSYNKIYNEWFRFENIQKKLHWSKGDYGSDTLSDYQLRKIGKNVDAFTSCLPWAQKGEPVQISLGTSAPIRRIDEAAADTLTLNKEILLRTRSDSNTEYPVTSFTSNSSAGENSYSLSEKTSIYYPVLSIGNTQANNGKTLIQGTYNKFGQNMNTMWNDSNFSKNTNSFIGDGHVETNQVITPAIGVGERFGTNTNFFLNSGAYSITADVAKLAPNQNLSKVNTENFYADLSAAQALTINDLRNEIMLQQYQELMARTGSGYYNEFVYTLWGVDMGDARIQRSQFLGEFSTTISYNVIAQTGATTETSPQGNLTAQGYGGTQNQLCFRHAFEDYGYVIGLACLKGDLTYSQGQTRDDLRTSKFDYFTPLFEHSGEVPIYNAEIYATGENSINGEGEVEGDYGIFGYNEYGTMERYHQSYVSGDFRILKDPNNPTQFQENLSNYTFQQYFEDRPVLSMDFLESDTPIDNSLFMQNNDTNHLMMYLLYKFKHYRQIPVYSKPGLRRI